MKRAYRGQEFWEQVVAEFKSSGLTQEVFANQKELKLSTFRRWYYLLRAPQPQEKTTQFVELTSATVVSGSSCKTTLHLLNGVSMEFNQPPSPSYLAEVLQAVGHI